MIKCPQCRRNLPDGARICRSCYTVIADAGRRSFGNSTNSPGLFWVGLNSVLFLLVLVSAFFLLQVYVPFLSSDSSGQPRWQSMSLIDTFGRKRSDESSNQKTRVTTSHKLDRRNGLCNIEQTVQNMEREPSEAFAFSIRFRDIGGSLLGEPVLSNVDQPIPASTSRPFTLRIACPEGSTMADVSVTSRKIGQGSSLVLVPSGETSGLKPQRAARTSLGPEFRMIVVEMPERLFCQPDAPCLFDVIFSDRRQASYQFYTNKDDPEQLIGTDPLLVAHLRSGKTARLVTDSPSGNQEITLSADNLVQVESHDSWADRIRKFFGSWG